MPTAPLIAPNAASSNARSQAVAVACGLDREARELDAEGRRLGVHAVRAPDADRVDVLARLRDQRVDEVVRAREDDLAGRRSWTASAVSSTSLDVSP